MRHYTGTKPDAWTRSELLAVSRRVLLLLISLYAATTARNAKYFISGGGHARLAETAGEKFWTALRDFSDAP